MSGDLSRYALRYSLIDTRSGSTITISKPPWGLQGACSWSVAKLNAGAGFALFAHKTTTPFPITTRNAAFLSPTSNSALRPYFTDIKIGPKHSGERPYRPRLSKEPHPQFV